MDAWLSEAKALTEAGKIGMYLVHNGVVRRSSRAAARLGEKDAKPVTGMRFSYDQGKVDAAIRRTERLEGIGYVRVWLNSGELLPGDDIMYVLVGGDIRPRVIDALQGLVETIKTGCVTEEELFTY